MAAAGGAGAGSPTPSGSDAPVERVVRPGETLWSIARGIVGPEGDPRPLIGEIREANELGAGPLLEGERLLIP